MLSEVRKEAFETRFVKSEKSTTATPLAEDEDDDADDAQTSNMFGGTVWSSWFPQEWVGWVMYGISSEHPTEHWVNQTLSDGPTNIENFFSDDKQPKSSLRPPGRSNQREKVTTESVNNKQISDANALRAHHVMQMAEELEMFRSKRDLDVIMNLRRLATTDDQKVSWFLSLSCSELMF